GTTMIPPLATHRTTSWTSATSSLFPYPPLFRSGDGHDRRTDAPGAHHQDVHAAASSALACRRDRSWTSATITRAMTKTAVPTTLDRKSTRLNSSHVKNSYAVFCLKKQR